MARRKRSPIIEGHPVWDALRDAQTTHDGRVLCPLCDRLWPWEFSNEMELDHVVPVSAGGDDDPDNLQLVCHSCNRIKGAKSQADARADCLQRHTMTAYEWRQGYWRSGRYKGRRRERRDTPEYKAKAREYDRTPARKIAEQARRDQPGYKAAQSERSRRAYLRAKGKALSGQSALRAV